MVERQDSSEVERGCVLCLSSVEQCRGSHVSSDGDGAIDKLKGGLRNLFLGFQLSIPSAAIGLGQC